MSWLAKITAPKVTERYPSAAAALAALKPIDVDRLPKLIISHNSLQFTASKWQEKVSQTITLRNPIPETLLAGQFSVAPHPSDPPHTPYDHAWISFDRATFEGDLVNCEMTVDTSKLRADTSYTREVLLDSNADAEPEVITVTVQTAPLPQPLRFAGWLGLVVMLVLGGLGGWLLPQIKPGLIQSLYATTIMGVGIGLNLIAIGTNTPIVINNKFDIFPASNILPIVAIALLRLTIILLPGLVAASALRRELKLRKYWGKYSRNELPLIKA
jgi:hypothetical protein